MNVNFGQQLASLAFNNFNALNVATQALNMLQSPNMQQFMQMGQQNSFGVGGGFAFGGVGGFNSATPGFLSPPMGSPAGFPQVANGMQGMQQPWNAMGNMLNGGMPGMMNMPNMQQMMGQLMGAMQSIANMMNQMAPQMQMMNQLNQAKQAVSMGQMPGMQPGMGMPGMQPGMGMPTAPGTTQLPGTPASFPGAPAADFLNSLPGDANGVAKALNVSGSKDVQTINKAANALKTAKPTITPGAPSDAKANLALSAADVQAIRSAQTPQEAKAIVMKAISKKTGVNLENINMKDQKGIRNDSARQAVNKLLGTNVRAGVEKNSGSSLVLDSMAESIVKSVRGGDFGSSKVQSPGGLAWAAFGGAAGMAGAQHSMGGHTGMAQYPGMDTNYQWGGMNQSSVGFGAGAAFGGFGVWQVPGQVQEIPNPAASVNVDLGAFTGAANTVGELGSPLIFDLEGTGLQITKPSMIAVDLDGDGKLEMITDLDAELGLLVFDSKVEGKSEVTGADMFGDNTDLTAYGVKAPTEDGSFKDGFQALRALCEHYKLVDTRKQYLDENDLSFLEQKVGLRMRVGGVLSGDNRLFTEVGVSQINLGNPAQTQHLEDAAEDKWGNKLMLQDGATFTVHGQVRKYADIWFKIQARYSDAPAKKDLSISKTDLFSKARR